MIIIDASDQIRIGRAQNFLEKEHVDRIFGWYNDFRDVENHTKVVSLEEIRAKDYNLNIPLHVEKITKTNLPTLEGALLQLEIAAKEAWEAEERFKLLLKEFKLL